MILVELELYLLCRCSTWWVGLKAEHSSLLWVKFFLCSSFLLSAIYTFWYVFVQIIFEYMIWENMMSMSWITRNLNCLVNLFSYWCILQDLLTINLDKKRNRLYYLIAMAVEKPKHVLQLQLPLLPIHHVFQSPLPHVYGIADWE